MADFIVPQILIGGVQSAGTIEQHKEWGQQAFTRLLQESLPPSPENYALFFCYYAQRIPDLNMSIDELSKQFGLVTQEQCNDLFTAHVGVEAERKALAKANHILDTELQKVLTLFDQASQGTDRFGKTLDHFNGQLNMPPEFAALKSIVGRVAQETHLIADQNSRLQTQLSQSTQQVTELRYSLDVVKQESLTDSLTEVGNRKFFELEIERLLHEAEETHVPLTLLMVDIDFFKKFNDNYGHLVGDQVLKLVGRVLRDNVKGRDVVTRYGGEEFAIILPQTPQEVGAHLAEQLRSAVGTRTITKKNSNQSLGTITLSIGVAQHQPGETLLQLIDRADKGLYQAKHSGRNRVVVYQSLE
jgi:diguanylate cyclase